MEETKVIYYIDDEETPYLMKISQSPGEVQLKDFKAQLNRAYQKFFFKSLDEDVGWVVCYEYPSLSTWMICSCPKRLAISLRLEYWILVRIRWSALLVVNFGLCGTSSCTVQYRVLCGSWARPGVCTWGRLPPGIHWIAMLGLRP